METRATGLLKRAIQLHIHGKAPSGASTASQLPTAADDGITAAERREIIASIDNVASRNRISVSSSAADLVPRKRGFVFPLVVNILIICVTAAVLLVLSFVFRQKDQSVEAGSAVVTTAEGKLIQEIKRESDSKLQEKDKAIAEIQDRLGSIDKQRNDLAANFEQRVAQREAELRAGLQAELDKERKRLVELGLSETAIQERLKKFEAEKTAAFNLQLENFKKQADADRVAADARLAQARDEYQKNISGLNDERKKILDDAKVREDQLRASMDAKTKELEGQSAAAKASLAKAQSDLSRLEEQRSKAQAAEDRILGLYGSIRTALRERRFDDALSSVGALESYLNDPTVLAVPSIQARRDADLFVADALGSLARTQLEKSSVDTSKLLDQAQLVATARTASAAGDRALKAGDAATAAARYQESLAAVPEILAAHDYFISKAKEEDTARRARLDSVLAEADKSWKAGDNAASLTRYAEALSMIPLDEVTRNAMVQRLGQVGSETAAKSGKATDSQAARGPFAAANRDLAAGKWADAMAGFIGIVGSYPAAEQLPAALKGIDQARAGMDKDATAQAAAYEKTIADLRVDAGRSSSSLQDENKSLTAALQAAKDGQAAAEKHAADAETRIAEAEKKVADAESRLKATQNDVARLQKQLADVQAASAQASVQAGTVKPSDAAAASSGDLKELAELRSQVGALQRSYASFMETENASGSASGNSAILERQKRLALFMGGAEFKALFPELQRIVETQVTSYQQQMSIETLRTAADIAIQAARAKTAAERNATLDSSAKHYADDPSIRGFIDVLRDMLK